MSFRSAFVTLFAGGFLFAVGCVENDQVVVDSGGGQDVTTGGDSATDSSTGNDAALDDAAVDDAGIVTDGGGNPDPDGGVLIDSGTDAATCGPPSANSPTVNSNCRSTFLLYAAGTVQPGNYNLASFTVQATAQYCSTYVPAGYSGRLVITANGGKFTFDERVVRTNIINLAPNKSFDVTVVNKQLSVVQACGFAVTPATWSYSSGTIATDAGTKNYILYTRNSGTSTVHYRWIQE